MLSPTSRTRSQAIPNMRGVSIAPRFAFNADLTGAIEAVHFAIGDVICRAGGHGSDDLGVQLQYGWSTMTRSRTFTPHAHGKTEQ